MAPQNQFRDPWTVGELELNSRVLLGTASYPSTDIMLKSLEVSGTQFVTVSMRRVSTATDGSENIYALLQQRGYHLLPNTAGCYTAKEAVLTAKMAREALQTNFIKLEVIADEETLLPESHELLKAADTLVRDGFLVLPYTNDDPVLALRLEQVGCVAVMPLAAPIGSGLGIRNPHNIELINKRSSVPVIIDAGLGTASDVAQAFELGCDAVLLNSAVSRAHDSVRMAASIGLAAQAGRNAFLAGRMPQKFVAQSASPLEGKAWTT